jgi:hypothetical protein
VTATDPWLVLGVAPGSSLADARAARRRLAKQLHPDLHAAGPAAEQAELAARMTLVNQALSEIEAVLAAADAPSPGPATPGPTPAATAAPQPAHATGPGDPESFSVECLPVDAFEALFLAAYGLGDILVAEEPYLLELYLSEPACFCRLQLVPEAGGSLVTVEVSPAADADEGPEPAAVVDVLVAELNALVAR